MDLSEKIRKLLVRSRSRSLTSLGREKLSCMDLPLLGEEGALCRWPVLILGNYASKFPSFYNSVFTFKLLFPSSNDGFSN